LPLHGGILYRRSVWSMDPSVIWDLCLRLAGRDENTKEKIQVMLYANWNELDKKPERPTILTCLAPFAQGNHVRSRVRWAHCSGLAWLAFPRGQFAKCKSMPPSQAYHGMKNDLLIVFQRPDNLPWAGMMSSTPINTQRSLAIYYGHGNRVVWAAQEIVKFVLIPWLFCGLPIGNENLFQWQLAKYEVLWSVPKLVYPIYNYKHGVCVSVCPSFTFLFIYFTRFGDG
jgi:hypothetical protein